jgi:hypothetical protein
MARVGATDERARAANGGVENVGKSAPVRLAPGGVESASRPKRAETGPEACRPGSMNQPDYGAVS